MIFGNKWLHSKSHLFQRKCNQCVKFDRPGRHVAHVRKAHLVLAVQVEKMAFQVRQFVYWNKVSAVFYRSKWFAWSAR
jgi:dimeric dUTPase (all-alpha-NTP-PPase superfamily)